MSVNVTSQPGNGAIKPEAPTIGTASAVAGGGATITFTASTNPGKLLSNGQTANYVATAVSGSVSTSASATSSPITFNAGTLSAGLSYTISVVKESGSGINSDASSSSNSITAFYVPAAPTITGATPGDQFLDITFTAGSANGSTITNYEYATSTNGSTYTSWAAFSPSDVTSPVRITGLTNGTNYYVKIRAVNSAGSGAESNVFRDASTLTTQPYGVPLSPTATLTDGCNTATWAFSANANGRTITEFTYQTSTNGGATWSGEVVGSSFSLDTSKASSATVVRVKAKNVTYGSYGAASAANAVRTAGTAVTQYSGSSCSRQSRLATPYSRAGCSAVEPTNYIYTSYVSDPDCTNTGDTTCWNSPTYAVVSSRYEGSCGNRVRYDTTRTTWTPKAGNTCATRTSDSEGSAIADPNCDVNNSTCYNAGTTSTVSRYEGSCSSRVRYDRTRTTWTPKAGTSCGVQTSDGPEGGAISDPDCGGLPSGYASNSCWTVQAYGSGEYVTLGSQRWLWQVDNYFFPTEYFAYKVDGSNNLQECCGDCPCGEFYIQCKSYWVYQCGSTYAANYRGCAS